MGRGRAEQGMGGDGERQGKEGIFSVLGSGTGGEGGEQRAGISILSASSAH